MKHLIEKIELALSDKTNEKARKDIARMVGYFEDKNNRYHIEEEFETESSMTIRTPSRRWPFSKYKHVMTNKYLKQLKEKIEANS